MSDLLFNRAARVSFQAPGAGDSDRTFDNLRISFDIEKDVDSTPNCAKLSIYNLSEDSRAYIQTKGSRAILSVGYQGRLDSPLYNMIFNGLIQKIETKRNAGSVITKFELIDGIDAYSGRRLDKSFDAGATIKQVFNELARAMAIPLGEIRGIREASQQFLRGYAASGLVRDQLNVLTKRTNTIWSIQDGALTVFPAEEGSLEDVFLLSSDTGLMGTPSTKDKDGKIGFKSLLIPQLKPGRRVRLKSSTVNGDFRLTKVKHEGDNTKGKWQSDCEAV